MAIWGEGEHMPLRILNPLYGGNFTADPGPALPFVLPGELVQTTPTFEILEPSPSRVPPTCAHFGTCGGCHYQHAAYPAQLEIKREILENLLTSAGLASLPEIQTESAAEYHYRNRIRLRFEPDSTGTFRAGYSLRGSNAFLPIVMCPIAAPTLWRTAETILALAQSNPLVHRWLTLTAELELFTTPGSDSDESKLQLHFFLRSVPNEQRSTDN
jgi:23S rRNA (uracil1939-C5)-methyltransferase